MAGWGQFKLIAASGVGIAVSNFDDDNDLEIVVPVFSFQTAQDYFYGNYGELHVFNLDGSEVEGWPVRLNGRVLTSPVVGDLDNDGKQDIVVGLKYDSRNRDNQFGGIYAFDRHGNVINGWPVGKGNKYFSSPSLSDLDSDGNLEVIAINGDEKKTEIYRQDGTSYFGWPQLSIRSDSSSATVGDIDGDGKPDILTPTNGISDNGGLFAWTALGQPVSGFPKITENDADSSAVITDLEGDGKVNIVTSSSWDWDVENEIPKWRGSIYVYELPTNFDASTLQWPMYKHDVQRTGMYQNLAPTSPGVARIELSIDKAFIGKGDTVKVTVANANPNSEIMLYVDDKVNNKMLIDGGILGYTNEEGKWFVNADTKDWPIGQYKAIVIVGGQTSNEINFKVAEGINSQCPSYLLPLNPTGVVKPTGYTTLITLSWPNVEEATSYNVRLYDGSSDRLDSSQGDARFQDCPNSPYYYCKNGIKSTSIDNVPVKRGRAYYYWVEPVVPGCGYFKGYTTFSITNFEKNPFLQIIDIESYSNNIRKGNPVNLNVSNAPPNSPIYLALLDAFGTPLGNILPLGSTQANGDYGLKIEGDKTAQWATGTYNVYAIIYDISTNEFVVSNKAEAEVI